MAVLKLKYPLAVGKSEIGELKFRDHTTAADYLAFDKRGGVAQRIALIASIAGVDEAVVMQLHGKDYLAAEAVVNSLLAADEVGDEEGGLEKK
jgi:Phage tail assembly chaperone proteins, E, or 41 or 14